MCRSICLGVLCGPLATLACLAQDRGPRLPPPPRQQPPAQTSSAYPDSKAQPDPRSGEPAPQVLPGTEPAEGPPRAADDARGGLRDPEDVNGPLRLVALVPAGRPLTEQLRRRVVSVDFEDRPLEEVFDWLRGITGCNVLVRWRVLEDLGVGRDTPVTLRLRDLPLERVLTLALAEAGGRARLAWRADDQTIVISSYDDIASEMIVRVYDVRDLVVPRSRVALLAVGRRHVIPIASDVTVAGGAVAHNVVPVPIDSGVRLSAGQPPDEGPVPAPGIEPAMRELIDVITSTIEPQSWEAAGGRGTIRAFQGRLVVRASPFVHQQLGGTLFQRGR